jgi:hypothetical protein
MDHSGKAAGHSDVQKKYYNGGGIFLQFSPVLYTLASILKTRNTAINSIPFYGQFER